jgi:cytochrome c553
MSRRITGSVALVCGAGLVSIFNEATADEQHPQPEVTRLIESIQGPALYKAYCAVCHGNSGRGDGPMAVSLKTKPPDLARIAARSGGAFPLAELRRIISGEVRIYNLAKYIEQMQVKWAAEAMERFGEDLAGFIQKPFTLETLLESVKAAVRS